MLSVLCITSDKKAVHLSGNREESKEIGCMFRNNAMVHDGRIRTTSNPCLMPFRGHFVTASGFLLFVSLRFCLFGHFVYWFGVFCCLIVLWCFCLCLLWGIFFVYLWGINARLKTGISVLMYACIIYKGIAFHFKFL